MRIARATRASWFALSNVQQDLCGAAETGDVALLEKLFILSVQHLEGKNYDEKHAELATLVEHADIQAVLPPSLSVPPISGAQVDVFAKYSDNWTILHYSARKAKNAFMTRLFELLLDSVDVNDIVAFINSVTKSGWTPLMMAVDKGHIDTVKLLLECGADATVSSKCGDTAVTLAKDAGNVEMLQLLGNALNISF